MKNKDIDEFASRYAEDIVKNFRQTGDADLSTYLLIDVDHYSELFRYRSTLVSKVIDKLASDRQDLHVFAECLLKQLCEDIRTKLCDEHTEFVGKLQGLFEFLVFMAPYLRNDSYVPSSKELRALVFDSMFENYLDESTSPLVRWGSLWIMRLYFSPTERDRPLLIFRKTIENLELQESQDSAEPDAYFSALIFLIKFFLHEDFGEYIPRLSERLRFFIRRYPLSGFVMYSFLAHGKSQFARFLQSILCCTDREPQDFGDKLNELPHCNVASRAIQGIGAFGDRQDLKMLEDNGFLEIHSRLTDNRQLRFLEQFTLYAGQEILSCNEIVQQTPSIATSLSMYLSDILRDQLGCLYDESNQALSIYANLHNDLRRRMELEKIAPESQVQSRIYSTANLILNSINDQYFRDKSYRSQKTLKVSLYVLNEELERLHDSMRSEPYSITDDKLWFESNTVDYMRKTVDTYLQERPEDLINLSQVSFTLWAEGRKLGDPDVPQYSDYVKADRDRRPMKHVIDSNRKIMESIRSHWDAERYSALNKISFLDIGGGVGNTTEAILNHFPEKTKRVFAIEFVPMFVRQYSRRVFLIVALERFIRRIQNVNFQIDCINADVYHFLNSLKNSNALELVSANKLRYQAFADMKNEGLLAIPHPNVFLRHLRKICIPEDEIVRTLEEAEKDQDRFWQETIGTYFSCYSTYSGLYSDLDERKLAQDRKNRKKDQARTIYSHWENCVETDRIEEAQKTFERLQEVVQSPSRTSDSEDRTFVPFPAFDVVVANYVLHHLTKDYRQQIYEWLLDLTSENAFLAIADPLLGKSVVNISYLNFTDEGVFASFNDLEGCIKEVQRTENGKRYYWKMIDGLPEENVGFWALFQKTKKEEPSTDFKGKKPDEGGLKAQDEIDVEELQRIISAVNTALNKHPEHTHDLERLKENLINLKVAADQLKKLETDERHLKVTNEQYFVMSGRLKIAIESYKHDVIMVIVPVISNGEWDESKRSKIERIKNTIKSNKDFFIALSDIVKSILS